MSLYLRSTATVAGVAVVGAATYAVYKTGTLRPVMVGTIKTGLKISNWTNKRYAAAKKRFKGLVADAKKEMKQETKTGK